MSVLDIAFKRMHMLSTLQKKFDRNNRCTCTADLSTDITRTRYIIVNVVELIAKATLPVSTFEVRGIIELSAPHQQRTLVRC